MLLPRRLSRSTALGCEAATGLARDGVCVSSREHEDEVGHAARTSARPRRAVRARRRPPRPLLCHSRTLARGAVGGASCAAISAAGRASARCALSRPHVSFSTDVGGASRARGDTSASARSRSANPPGGRGQASPSWSAFPRTSAVLVAGRVGDYTGEVRAMVGAPARIFLARLPFRNACRHRSSHSTA